MTATQIPVAATASTITSSIATTNPTYFPFQSLTTTGSNCAGATLFTGALNIPPCTGGGSLPSGSLGFTTSNSNGSTTYAASGSNGIDCSQMSGTNLDDQLNNCNAYAITTGVGVMNARYMGNPANFITKEVEKGELVQPTVAAATGTSPGAGTYFVSYVLNSPMVSPSSASKENAVTVTGSQEIQVTSPTYAGTATTYSVYATPTGVAGTGTVSTAGTSAVTWVSGTQFTTGSAWNGQAININGATFTISSVGSATSLTLTGSSTPTGTFPYFTGMWTEKLCSGATNVAIGTNVNLTAACSGSAINTNNHPWGVALWQPYSGSWQIAASANLGTDPITGNGNCAIKNFDQSADDQNQFAIGEGVTFVVTSAGSATYASGWCDDDNPKAGSSYIKHHGEAFTAVASDTITRAGIEYRHLFDSSELDNATTVMAGNAGGPGVWIWGVCCQTSGRHIHVESNGAANNGIVLGNDSVGSSHGGVSNISFYDLVSVHAAVPYSEFVAGSPELLGTTVHGLYMEGPGSVTCSQNIISITPNQSASGPFEIDNASMGGNCSTATGVFANVAHTLQQFRMRNVSSGNFLSVLNYAPDTTKNYSIASAGQVVGDIGFNTQSRPDQLTYLNATDWLETPEIVDSNTNEILGFTTTTSAVDYANITNGATGSPGTVTIAAKGTDSNINLNLVSKGSGTVECNGTSCGSGGPGTGTQYTHPYWSTTSALGSVAPTTGYDGVPQVETNSTTSGVFTAAPVSSPQGVPVDLESGSTFTVALTDRYKVLNTTNATTSTAVTVPAPSTTGFGLNFVFAHLNSGSVVATDTPTTATVNGNSTMKLVGAVAGHNPEAAFWWEDSSTSCSSGPCYWGAEILPTDANGQLAAEGLNVANACPTCVVASSPGVGIAHFAGSTQTVTSSTIATGDIAANAVTLAKLATQTANTVLANVTGSTAVPTAAAIPAGVQFYTAGTGYSAATAAQLGTVLNIASGLVLYSGGTAAAPVGSTDWSASATTLTSAAAGTLNMSASTGAPSVQLPAVVGGTILAGTSTANLSAPVVIQNTNSSNNNTSITMGVSSPGTSTGQTTLNVNCATTQGNCLEAGTGGTWTAGVLSGQTKVFQVLPTGQTTLGTGPTVAGSPTSAFILGTTGTCPTAQASAGFLCPSSSSDNTYYWNVNNASVNQHLPQTAITSGSAYTNATTGFTSVAGGSGQTLAFTVAASTNYVVTCNILWQGSAGTAGPKFQWTGPASPTAVTASMHSPVTTATYLDATATAFSSPMADTGTITTATNFNAVVTLGLVNGTTAGTATLQAAANGTGTLTIEPGSFCEIQ